MSKFGNVFVKSSDTGNSQLVSNINAVRVKANTITGESMVLNQGIDVANATIRGGVKIDGGTEINSSYLLNYNYGELGSKWELYRKNYPSIITPLGDISNRFYQKVVWAEGFDRFLLTNQDAGIRDTDGRPIVSSRDGLHWGVSFNTSWPTNCKNVSNDISSSDYLKIECDDTSGLEVGWGITLAPGTTPDNWAVISQIISNNIFKTTTRLTIPDGSQLHASTITSAGNNIPFFIAIGYSKELNIAVTQGWSSTAHNPYYSENGEKWFESNVNGHGITGLMVEWSPFLSMFIMTTLQGPLYAISYDGKNWDSNYSFPKNNGNAEGMKWLGNPINKFVACFSTGSNYILVSNNGIDWNEISMPDVSGSGWGDVEYSNELGKIVAVSRNGLIVYTDDIVNFTNWQNASYEPISGVINRVRWFPELNKFYAVYDPFPYVISSSDGINWIKPDVSNVDNTSSAHSREIAYSPKYNRLVISQWDRLAIISSGNVDLSVNSTIKNNNGVLITSQVETTRFSQISKLITIEDLKKGIIEITGGDLITSTITLPPRSNLRTLLNSINDSVEWYIINGKDTVTIRTNVGHSLNRSASTIIGSNETVKFITRNADGINFITYRLTSFLTLGAPVTINNNYNVPFNINRIITNKNSTITLTLPLPSLWTGREIVIKNINTGSVISNSENVVPLLGGTAQTSILPGGSAGSSTSLISDGNNWIIMR
jgi:hypothetical protein